MVRRTSFRVVAGVFAVSLIGGLVAALAPATPAFAAGSITESPTSPAAWAQNVPYGSVGAPSGITLTVKTCPSGTGVTSTSGPGGTAGLTITGTNAADLVVDSYSASNTAASSTVVVGANSSSYLPPGGSSFTFNAYSGGTLCVTSASYTINIQNAVVTTVGGGASGTSLGFYDYSYNQSNSQTLDFVDSDTSAPSSGLDTFAVSAATGTGFVCTEYNSTTPADNNPNAQPPAGDYYPNSVSPPTPYDHYCNLQAAPGDNDDSGVTGANGPAAENVTVTEYDPTYPGGNASPAYSTNVYPPPICGFAPDGTGSLSGTTDTLYGPSIAEACYDGASANPNNPYNASVNPASTLLTGIATGGGTIYTGSNPIDARGGTALSIMAGPGFNWTGGYGSGEADVDTGTAGLNKQAWSGATTSAPPPSTPLTNMSASTVASEASFKSSGDPLNTCPPPAAVIDSGMPFCFEEFEATGAGPSAAQAALEYSGQALPTSTTPTISLSNSASGSIAGATVTATDQSGACPATIGTGTNNLFSTGINCWYARAGDATPVTATITNGNTVTTPLTVTPTNPNVGDVSEGNYDVDGPSDTSTFDGAGTITLMNVMGNSNNVSCSATSAGTATAPYSDLLGDGVSGTDIPIGTQVTAVNNSGAGSCSFTLSNKATATPAAETLTFYSVVLNPPQLSAQLSVPAGAATAGNTNTIQICESTTPTNGNDWEFGLQWLTSQGTLQNGEVCANTSYDGLMTASSTTTNPTIQNITLGQSNTDAATVTGFAGGPTPSGTVTFYTCGENVSPCTSANWTQLGTPAGVSGSGDTASATSTSFTPDSTGTWCFAAVYSGDSNYSGSTDDTTDECYNVGQASSSTGTSPANGSITLGASNFDSATVTGNDSAANAPDPIGTVTFYNCGENVSPCTSANWSQLGSPVNLSGLGNPETVSSNSFTPDSTGTWCFAAVYSGDGNYIGSSDESTDECYTVSAANSSTSSAPTSSSVVLGASNTDVATVTGDDGAANAPALTGSVDFYTCPENVSPCTPTTPGATPDPNNPIPLVGDSATSTSFTPNSTGTWCYAAVYSGDGNYNGSSDDSVDECFTVSQTSSSTVSTPTSSTAALDGPNTDSVLVTGNDAASNAPYPSGTVTFYTCGENVVPCTAASWTRLGNPVDLGVGALNTNTATSAPFNNTSPGTWCFAAVYSGDANYTGSSDDTTNECYTVSQDSTGTISAPINSIITQSQSNADQATVTGNAAVGAPTGTVTFYECGPTPTPVACTSGTQLGNPVNVTTSGSHTASATSARFTPSASPTNIGYWCFRAVYGGDGNYYASSDNSSVDECFYVTGPLVVTTASPLTSGTVGVHYSVQLAAAGGESPYTWTHRGTLPRGLHLSATGLLYGTPTRNGTFTFTAKVSDSTTPHHEKASKVLTVTINP